MMEMRPCAGGRELALPGLPVWNWPCPRTATTLIAVVRREPGDNGVMGLCQSHLNLLHESTGECSMGEEE